ncbi:hypothetical protein RJ640_000889, partial [Escallonia rubra]
MAETLLIDASKGILSKVLSLVANEANLARGFKGELKRLAETLKMIQDLLSDAESKQLTLKAVKTWLKSLNAVAYDADTVLDEFSYELLRRQVVVRDRKEYKVRDLFSASNNPLLFRFKIAHKIKAINLSLDDIYKEANAIGLKPVDLLNSSAGTGNQEVPVTHPGLGDSEVIVGRDADMSMVADMLLMPKNKNGFPVISIVGMPGQGKTTLAKLIYKNDKVVRHFDEFIWVSVSDDFLDKRILNEMGQSLTQTNPQLSNMGGILKELRKHLNGKKYLVVLDDVWNEIPEKWESLRDALLEIGGSSESKVLVTTRSSKVASTMISLTYPLKHLSDDDSWIMFKPKAFANGGAVETSDLVEIGREIVKKCRGVPLAIKVVGGLMYSKKSKPEWLAVQHSQLWELPANETGDIWPILKLSYDHLPSSSLKQCFAYCSILPKDSEINKENLIHLWMALGLLHPSERNHLMMEDVGSNYFDILLWNSFLQDVVKDDRDKGCQIEDLGGLNDLKGKLKIFGLEDVRTTEEAKKANLLKKSHINALQFHWSGGEEENTDEVFSEKGNTDEVFSEEGNTDEVFSEEENTDEVFSEEWNTGEKVLEGITTHSSLKRLTGQNFRGKNFSSWMMMPSKSSVVLQNLVYIKLKYCRSSEQIPTLGHLICLKFIHIENLCNVKRIGAEFYGPNAEGATGSGRGVSAGGAMFPALTSLCLRNLPGLEEWLEAVHPSPSVKVFPCLDVLELKRIPKLSMVPSHFPAIKDLSIRGINVAAVLQKMSCKLTTLTSLVMRFVNGSDLQLLMEELLGRNISLKNLQIWNCPNFSYLPIQKLVALETLRINECGDLTSISDEIGGLTSLKNFSLEECRKLTCLPKGLESLVSLESLRIEGIQELSVFPDTLLLTSLRTIRIGDFKKLIRLPKGLKTLSSLVDLCVDSCPKLKAFPDVHRLKSLERLQISRCKILTSLPRGLQDCTSLQTLGIRDCPALKSTMDLRCLTSLRWLTIGGFSEELNYFPWPSSSSASGACVSSLEFLELCGWPMLKSLPVQLEQLYALKELYLLHFPGLEARPGWLGNLSSLNELRIFDCSKLTKMPSVEAMKRLSKLEELDIASKAEALRGSRVAQALRRLPLWSNSYQKQSRNCVAMAWKFYERSTGSFIPHASGVAMMPDKELIVRLQHIQQRYHLASFLVVKVVLLVAKATAQL